MSFTDLTAMILLIANTDELPNWDTEAQSRELV
jgi:hypothetical protein